MYEGVLFCEGVMDTYLLKGMYREDKSSMCGILLSLSGGQ